MTLTTEEIELLINILETLREPPLDDEEAALLQRLRTVLETPKPKDYDLSTHIGRTNLYHHLLGI